MNHRDSNICRYLNDALRSFNLIDMSFSCMCPDWRGIRWFTPRRAHILGANYFGKKELIEWCMKEGLIASSYECPKCNDQHDVTWSAIKRILRNRTRHAECMFNHYLAE
ncbi:uncharacterized protein TNCV_3423231 [Trichonephila clavipes]|nr:uncharacterized protein TNCV_3423231 [Trichonephila clavipes]